MYCWHKSCQPQIYSLKDINVQYFKSFILSFCNSCFWFCFFDKNFLVSKGVLHPCKTHLMNFLFCTKLLFQGELRIDNIMVQSLSTTNIFCTGIYRNQLTVSTTKATASWQWTSSVSRLKYVKAAKSGLTELLTFHVERSMKNVVIDLIWCLIINKVEDASFEKSETFVFCWVIKNKCCWRHFRWNDKRWPRTFHPLQLRRRRCQ